MSVVDAVGWIAAASSASLAVPQGARIAMTRSVAGVSVIAWQTMLIAGIAWTAHGLLYGTAQIIWPNALLAVTSAWVLSQLVTAHRLPVIKTWTIPIAVAAVAFLANVTAGPLAFAAVAFVPGAIGQISQLREILRVPDPSGVSMVALAANLLNQVLWFSYALPAHEVAVLAVCIPMSFLITAGIVALWWRRREIAGGHGRRARVGALPIFTEVPPVSAGVDAPAGGVTSATDMTQPPAPAPRAPTSTAMPTGPNAARTPCAPGS